MSIILEHLSLQWTLEESYCIIWLLSAAAQKIHVLGHPNYTHLVLEPGNVNSKWYSRRPHRFSEEAKPLFKSRSIVTL